MFLKFKVIEKVEPSVIDGGSKKIHISPDIKGEKTLAGLTRDIEKIGIMSGADIRAVLM